MKGSTPLKSIGKFVLKASLALVLAFGLGLLVLDRINPLPHALEDRLKSDLRTLAALQEQHLEKHREYADDLTSLEYVSSDGVTVRLEANADSWAATSEYHAGSFPSRVDIDCALVVGPLSVPSWGAIDMTTLTPGVIRCIGIRPGDGR